MYLIIWRRTMRKIVTFSVSIAIYFISIGLFNLAYALDFSSHNAASFTHALELNSLSSDSYQIAKSTFLPNIKDSEIGFIGNTNNRDDATDSSSRCGSEYSLSACPRYGKCSLCIEDTINKHYRWDGCEDGYYPNPNYENTCSYYSCSVENYKSSVPPQGAICNQIERYGKTCYDCTINTDYNRSCDMSSYASTEGIANLEKNPDCQNLSSNQVCSEKHCKLICQSGYYTQAYLNQCKKDTCPSEYQLEQCSASEKLMGTTQSTYKTSTCYKCANDSCPDGYSKAACQEGYTVVDTKLTAAGSTCRKCADGSCPSGSYKPVEGGTPPDACPSGYEYTGEIMRSPAGTTCYVCKKDICPINYAKTKPTCLSGYYLRTTYTDFGSICYKCAKDCPTGMTTTPYHLATIWAYSIDPNLYSTETFRIDTATCYHSISKPNLNCVLEDIVTPSGNRNSYCGQTLYTKPSHDATVSNAVFDYNAADSGHQTVVYGECRNQPHINQSNQDAGSVSCQYRQLDLIKKDFTGYPNCNVTEPTWFTGNLECDTLTIAADIVLDNATITANIVEVDNGANLYSRGYSSLTANKYFNRLSSPDEFVGNIFFTGMLTLKGSVDPGSGNHFSQICFGSVVAAARFQEDGLGGSSGYTSSFLWEDTSNDANGFYLFRYFFIPHYPSGGVPEIPIYFRYTGKLDMFPFIQSNASSAGIYWSSSYAYVEANNKAKGIIVLGY